MVLRLLFSSNRVPRDSGREAEDSAMMTFNFALPMVGSLASGIAVVPDLQLIWQASSSIILAVLAILWPVAGFAILATVRRRQEVDKPVVQRPVPRSIESRLDFRQAA